MKIVSYFSKWLYLTIQTGPHSVPPLHVVDPEDIQLLKWFRDKVNSLPKLVQKATANHPLALFNVPPTDQVSDAPLNELWEYMDQKLNVLIPQENGKEKLHNLVIQGKLGLSGLATLAEYLVMDCRIIGGMLKGKLDRVMKAIDK